MVRGPLKVLKGTGLIWYVNLHHDGCFQKARKRNTLVSITSRNKEEYRIEYGISWNQEAIAKNNFVMEL